MVEAAPVEVERSADLGPTIEKLADVRVLQDHELTLSTSSERITIAGPSSIEIAPLDDPARRVVGPDGMWAVEQDYKTHHIVYFDAKLPKPVAIHRGSALIRFAGAVAQQRTVVLDRGNWGWFVARSQDGGKKWSETKHEIVGSIIETPRRFFDLVTRGGDWIRIDREGDVRTVPLLERDVEPDWLSCASTSLWIHRGKRLLWFDEKMRGNVNAEARGQMICAGEDVLVPVDGGLARCTRAGCGAVVPKGTFADLTATGIATATQRGATVRVVRSDGAMVDVQLREDETLVGMAVWDDTPTLVLLGASKRLVLAAVR